MSPDSVELVVPVSILLALVLILWTGGVLRLIEAPAPDRAVFLTGRVSLEGEPLGRLLSPGGRALRVPFLEVTTPLDLTPVHLSAKAGSRRLEATVEIDLDVAEAAARRIGRAGHDLLVPLARAILIPRASEAKDGEALKTAARLPLRRLGLKLTSARLR